MSGTLNDILGWLGIIPGNQQGAQNPLPAQPYNPGGGVGPQTGYNPGGVGQYPFPQAGYNPGNSPGQLTQGVYAPGGAGQYPTLNPGQEYPLNMPVPTQGALANSPEASPGLAVPPTAALSGQPLPVPPASPPAGQPAGQPAIPPVPAPAARPAIPPADVPALLAATQQAQQPGASAQPQGFDLGDFMHANSLAENGSQNPLLKNPDPNATAYGLSQINQPTWDALFDKGAVPVNYQTLRSITDPSQSAQIQHQGEQALAQQNMTALQAKGTPITYGSMRAGWALGTGGANSLWGANAADPTMDALTWANHVYGTGKTGGAYVLKQYGNPQTVGELVNHFNQWGNMAAGGRPGQGANVPPQQAGQPAPGGALAVQPAAGGALAGQPGAPGGGALSGPQQVQQPQTAQQAMFQQLQRQMDSNQQRIDGYLKSNQDTLQANTVSPLTRIGLGLLQGNNWQQGLSHAVGNYVEGKQQDMANTMGVNKEGAGVLSQMTDAGLRAQYQNAMLGQRQDFQQGLLGQRQDFQLGMAGAEGTQHNITYRDASGQVQQGSAMINKLGQATINGQQVTPLTIEGTGNTQLAQNAREAVYAANAAARGSQATMTNFVNGKQVGTQVIIDGSGQVKYADGSGPVPPSKLGFIRTPAGQLQHLQQNAPGWQPTGADGQPAEPPVMGADGGSAGGLPHFSGLNDGESKRLQQTEQAMVANNELTGLENDPTWKGGPGGTGAEYEKKMLMKDPLSLQQLVGSAFTSPQDQRAAAALNRFVLGVAHAESGARTPDELLNQYRRAFSTDWEQSHSVTVASQAARNALIRSHVATLPSAPSQYWNEVLDGRRHMPDVAGVAPSVQQLQGTGPQGAGALTAGSRAAPTALPTQFDQSLVSPGGTYTIAGRNGTYTGQQILDAIKAKQGSSQ